MSTSSTAPSSHKRRRWKRLLFCLLMLVLVVVVLELGVRAVAVFTDTLNMEILREQQLALVAGQPAEGAPSEAVHPYLGWVLNPDAKQMQPVNELGFTGAEQVLAPREPGKLRVAVLGGSIANEFVHKATETIVSRLRTRPQLRDVDIEIIPLALSGYKQPQQLLVLNYVHSLGAEFDAVINIDGYNEIALHRTGKTGAATFSMPIPAHGRHACCVLWIRCESSVHFACMNCASPGCGWHAGFRLSLSIFRAPECLVVLARQGDPRRVSGTRS